MGGSARASALADLSPELYIDPNQIVRKEIKDGTLMAKKDDAKAADKKLVDAKGKDAKSDPAVLKAGASVAK